VAESIELVPLPANEIPLPVLAANEPVSPPPLTSTGAGRISIDVHHRIASVEKSANREHPAVLGLEDATYP